MQQTIKFDMIKVSTNEIYSGAHWTKRKQYKDDYHWVVKGKHNINKVSNYPVKLRFTFCFKNNPLDASNCSYMGKMLEDAMVKEGYLINDSYEYVETVVYETKKSDQDCIVLEIFEKMQDD